MEDDIIKYSSVPSMGIGRLHPLHVHAKLGNVLKAKRLLEEDPKSINVTDCMLDTPLHFAAWGSTENHVELVKLFLSKGATVDALNIHGKTALHKASRSNCCGAVDALLHYGAVINIRSTTGMTPLHDASVVGAADAVERLLVRGANVNSRDNTGETPAHMASTYGHTSVLKVLLAHGANINMQTSEGFTPLHVACYAGNRNLPVIDLLLLHNADVDITSNRGDTALHKAVLRSYIHQPNKIYEKLLEKGACIDVKNREGETPYDICLVDENDEEEVVIKTALEKHIVKLKTAGVTVDISLNTDSEELRTVEEECVRELQRMKVTKLNDVFSLDHVFLYLNNPWYLKNLDTLLKLEERFSCVDFFQIFPMYGHILRSCVDKAKQRLDLLETALVSFNSERRKPMWSLRLPNLVKFEILDYLSNVDLRNFLESEWPPDE